MASPPCLEIDPLLEPIPGDEPAGESVSFMLREKLEELRKEVNPEAFAADDPLRPEQKFADWPGIVRVCTEQLTESSKDLMLAARLTEALVKTNGFAGLREGLVLLRRLVDECWDRIHPSIEDGDLEVRAKAFNWLDDPDRGARFPAALRGIPLLDPGGQRYGWHHWKMSQEGKGGVTAESFDAAVQSTTRDFALNIVEDLDQCVTEVEQLQAALDAKMGDVSPGIQELKKTIGECRALSEQILNKKGGRPIMSTDEPLPEDGEAGAVGEDGEPLANGTGGGGGGGGSRTPRTRNEVYQALSQAASILQELEPHSPIPYLIHRAIELGALPFPQLMKALIRDSNILTEMNRELGIKEDG